MESFFSHSDAINQINWRSNLKINQQKTNRERKRGKTNEFNLIGFWVLHMSCSDHIGLMKPEFLEDEREMSTETEFLFLKSLLQF